MANAYCALLDLCEVPVVVGWWCDCSDWGYSWFWALVWHGMVSDMNKHIELVKKWLDDPSSVTVEQLRVNTESADSAADAAVDAVDAAYAAAAAYAAYDADYAADAAAAAYADDAYAADAAYAAARTADAEYYVKKYEELTGEFGEV